MMCTDLHWILPLGQQQIDGFHVTLVGLTLRCMWTRCLDDLNRRYPLPIEISLLHRRHRQQGQNTMTSSLGSLTRSLFFLYFFSEDSGEV